MLNFQHLQKLPARAERTQFGFETASLPARTPPRPGSPPSRCALGGLLSRAIRRLASIVIPLALLAAVARAVLRGLTPRPEARTLRTHRPPRTEPRAHARSHRPHPRAGTHHPRPLRTLWPHRSHAGPHRPGPLRTLWPHARSRPIGALAARAHASLPAHALSAHARARQTLTPRRHARGPAASPGQTRARLAPRAYRRSGLRALGGLALQTDLQLLDPLAELLDFRPQLPQGPHNLLPADFHLALPGQLALAIQLALACRRALRRCGRSIGADVPLRRCGRAVGAGFPLRRCGRSVRASLALRRPLAVLRPALAPGLSQHRAGQQPRAHNRQQHAPSCPLHDLSLSLVRPLCLGATHVLLLKLNEAEMREP